MKCKYNTWNKRKLHAFFQIGVISYHITHLELPPDPTPLVFLLQHQFLHPVKTIINSI